MNQTKITESWEVVKEEIERNKTKRTNWKSILGMSLKKFVYMNCEKEPAQLERFIIETYNLDEELKRRLKISLAAAYVYANSKRGN